MYGDTHITRDMCMGIHISLGICVWGYTYHCDTGILWSLSINQSIINLFISIRGVDHPSRGSCMKRMTIRIVNNNTIHFNKNNFKRLECIKTNENYISVNTQSNTLSHPTEQERIILSCTESIKN